MPWKLVRAEGCWKAVKTEAAHRTPVWKEATGAIFLVCFVACSFFALNDFYSACG